MVSIVDSTYCYCHSLYCILISLVGVQQEIWYQGIVSNGGPKCAIAPSSVDRYSRSARLCGLTDGDHQRTTNLHFAPDLTNCNDDQPIAHPHRSQLPWPVKYYLRIAELTYRDTRRSSGDFPFLGRITSMVHRGRGHRRCSLRGQHQRLAGAHRHRRRVHQGLRVSWDG
jgi:hypothetical protein